MLIYVCFPQDAAPVIMPKLCKPIESKESTSSTAKGRDSHLLPRDGGMEAGGRQASSDL